MRRYFGECHPPCPSTDVRDTSGDAARLIGPFHVVPGLPFALRRDPAAPAVVSGVPSRLPPYRLTISLKSRWCEVQDNRKINMWLSRGWPISCTSFDKEFLLVFSVDDYPAFDMPHLSPRFRKPPDILPDIAFSISDSVFKLVP